MLITTLQPFLAKVVANRVVVVDFPTPPFPEIINKIFFTLHFSMSETLERGDLYRTRAKSRAPLEQNGGII